jgi:hypothetical protein
MQMEIEIKYIIVLLLVFVRRGVVLDWYTLGSAEISTGQVYYLSMVLVSDGTQHIGFAVGANGAKPTAMCFDGSNWVTIGTAGFTNGMPSDLNFSFVRHFLLCVIPNTLLNKHKRGTL